MKKLLMAALVCFASAGCHSAPNADGTIMVTTPTGRKQPVTRRYTVEEIAAGSAAAPISPSPFSDLHPVYPSKAQLDQLKRHLKEGSEIWYFQGLDSGWAVIKNRKVVWTLVTSHEF